MAAMRPLNEVELDILRRGGADGLSDDGMLLLELRHRAPGDSLEGYQAMFIALMENTNGDTKEALWAIRNGHVKFEARPTVIEGTATEVDDAKV